MGERSRWNRRVEPGGVEVLARRAPDALPASAGARARSAGAPRRAWGSRCRRRRGPDSGFGAVSSSGCSNEVSRGTVRISGSASGAGSSLWPFSLTSVMIVHAPSGSGTRARVCLGRPPPAQGLGVQLSGPALGGPVILRCRCRWREPAGPHRNPHVRALVRIPLRRLRAPRRRSRTRRCGRPAPRTRTTGADGRCGPSGPRSPGATGPQPQRPRGSPRPVRLPGHPGRHRPRARPHGIPHGPAPWPARRCAGVRIPVPVLRSRCGPAPRLGTAQGPAPVRSRPHRRGGPTAPRR